jgi:DNA-binding PadR family transcriptional regulator
MCARGRGRGFDWNSAWAAWCGPGFGPGPGFREEMHKRRGGRGRFFDRGDLKYMILRLLARKPMHGYEVMQALTEESGGWYAASAGSVYPVLQLLQDQGYVTSVETNGRRVYSISEEGKAFLQRHTERVDDVMDRVSGFAGRFASGEMEEVARSFMRLARESFEQSMRASGNPAMAARIREILEKAIQDLKAANEGNPAPEGGENA